MHNVLFVISALAGAAGFALLRWSAARGAPAPAADPPPPPPLPPAEAPTVAKPLRVTVVVVEPPAQSRLDGATTITLPSAHLAAFGDDHRAKTSTTYLVEGVEVELNDFFDSLSTLSQQASTDLRHCDLVVRGDGNHVPSTARHVVTRAAMPLGVLMKDEDLVKTCARALADPAHRAAFADRIAEVVAEGDVLGWLERHEQALTNPLPANETTRIDTADLEIPKPPWRPPDQRKWPFVFEPRAADDEARRPS